MDKENEERIIEKLDSIRSAITDCSFWLFLITIFSCGQ